MLDSYLVIPRDSLEKQNAWYRWVDHFDPITRRPNPDSFPRLGPLDSEETCALLLYAAKWPNGFRCPRCGHAHALRINTRRLPLFQCARCRHQASLTAGTLFEKSRTPLTKWFLALYWFAACGINAVALQSLIGVTYKTAWLMLAKIRYAVHFRDAQTLLSGWVRIMPSDYGTLTSARRFEDRRFRPQLYPLIVGASLHPDGRPQALKIKLVPEAELPGRSYHSLEGADIRAQRWFAAQHVEARGSHVQFFDSYYARAHLLAGIGYRTKPHIIRIYRGIGFKHLQAYIDERAFRLLAHQDADVPPDRQLLNICAASSPIPYASIIRINGLSHCMDTDMSRSIA